MTLEEVTQALNNWTADKDYMCSVQINCEGNFYLSRDLCWTSEAMTLEEFTEWCEEQL